MQYKQDFSFRLSLSEIQVYQQLFDIQIHPFDIQLVLMMDREYTYSINKTIQDRKPKEY